MNSLKSTLERLANDFALSVIGALRMASIDELSEVAGGAVRSSTRGAAPAPALGRRRGRLGRRSPADIGRMVDDIVALLEKHPEGLRSEQIRDALGCQAKELPRPLAEALTAGRVKKSGQKRATTYTVGDGTKPRRGRKKR